MTSVSQSLARSTRNVSHDILPLYRDFHPVAFRVRVTAAMSTYTAKVTSSGYCIRVSIKRESDVRESERYAKEHKRQR